MAFGPGWRCPRCGHEFAARNQVHACAEPRSLEAHLEGRSPEVREIVARVIAPDEVAGWLAEAYDVGMQRRWRLYNRAPWPIAPRGSSRTAVASRR